MARKPVESVEDFPEAEAGNVTSAVWEASRIHPDQKNARKHPKAQIEAIRASIRRFGFVSSLIVADDGELIGGNATFEAAQMEGIDKFPVRVVSGLTESQRRALAIALNKLPEGSSWNEDALVEALRGLDDDDAQATGFTDAELKKLLGEPDPIKVVELSTGPLEDEFWISIRGPIKFQAKVLKAMRDATAGMISVSVELGTIGIEDDGS